MQKEEFYNLLKNPGNLNKTGIDKLRVLTEEYPYFQWAQMLYLKHLKEISSPEFNNVLKKVAVSVPDRKQLYRFINSKNTIQSTLQFDYKKESIPAFKSRILRRN